MQPQPKERRLIERVQEGDEQAFEALFRTHYEALCNFVEPRVGSPEVAEDLVQNVFLNLWRRRQDWEPRTTLQAYLFGAARNEAIKYRKHRQVRRDWKREKKKEKTHGESEFDPGEDLKHRELNRAVQECVSELPERRREVYLLSRQYGLTYEEIAGVMDISPSTVDNQMVKALESLRKNLSPFLSSTV